MVSRVHRRQRSIRLLIAFLSFSFAVHPAGSHGCRLDVAAELAAQTDAPRTAQVNRCADGPEVGFFYRSSAKRLWQKLAQTWLTGELAIQTRQSFKSDPPSRLGSRADSRNDVSSVCHSALLLQTGVLRA